MKRYFSSLSQVNLIYSKSMKLIFRARAEKRLPNLNNLTLALMSTLALTFREEIIHLVRSQNFPQN